MTDLPSINMDQIVSDSILPPGQFLSFPKQTPTDKKKWQNHYQLLDWSLPSPSESPSIKRLLKTKAIFKDSKTGKTFEKTFFFGSPRDYVFTQDREYRLAELKNMKQKHNPLHSDYWRTQICFASPDITDNIINLCKYIVEKRLGHLMPKKKK